MAERGSIKLLLTWDLREGVDQEYFEFVVRELVPGTAGMGLKMVAAWFTVYRRDESTPQIMAEAEARDLHSLRLVLASSEWAQLLERLKTYVVNYQQKAVPMSGSFRL
jgi:hypothetical protein